MNPYSSVVCGDWNKIEKVSVFYAQPGKKGFRQINRILQKKDYDLVYVNSFFSPRFSIFPLLIAKLLRQKVVLGPRGEFSEGALSLKSFKKRVFIKIFKLLGLHKGLVFQASSAFESEDIRRVLGKAVDIYVAEDIGAREFAQNLSLRTSKTLKAAFVSRISPKKNLLAALEMLRDVQHPLEYHIYGPIEDSEYWYQCEKVIADLPAHITVKHMGSLMPDEVVNTLSNYDVFFFPTKGENYGHVIAEALCAALPIVIADTTPWRNLQQQGIGWDLPLNNPGAYSTVLDELAAMSPEQHLEMRQNVLAWAKNKFSQRDAIEANIAMFKYAYEKK
jgi:glycosyltransferase involved in cell wall biosynthesis